eukprot:GFUD01015166.1.p1 GENE.GFUD01015166.1~~GFUD01015166.1.p1  ORF type:complete len:470 (+),score=101.94 GFUD01015166.1:86-1495(+)
MFSRQRNLHPLLSRSLHQRSRPHEMPSPPPGTYLREAGTDRIHQYSQKWHGLLGPIFREDLGGCQAVFISCPEVCQAIFAGEGRYPVHLVPEPWTIYLQKKNKKRGLFFMDGEEWWETRKRLNPLFLKHLNVKKMHPTVERGVESLIGGWKPGKLANLESQLYTWSTSTMLAILLGDNTVVKERLEEVIEEVVWHVQQIFVTSAALSTVDPHQAAQQSTSAWQEFEHHVETGLALVQHLVIKTLADPGGHQGLALDLVQLGFSEDDIVRILADLLLAAADTTSITGAWLLHVLATTPDVQAAVGQETAGLCGAGQARATDIKHLRYSAGLVREVMRLYPVAPFLTRIAQKPMQLGSYQVDGGTLLLMSSYAMGRNGDIFDHPNEVRPDRWKRNLNTKDLQRSTKAFASLPFGHGARGCIGRRVAEMELNLLASRACQEWKMTSGEKEVLFTMRMVGIPDKPISLHLEKI